MNKRNKRWTDTELEFVRKNAGLMWDKDIAAFLTRMTGRRVTAKAVTRCRQRLGMKKKHGRGRCELVNLGSKVPAVATSQ